MAQRLPVDAMGSLSSSTANLELMSLLQLRQLAEQLGLQGYAAQTRLQLIEALARRCDHNPVVEPTPSAATHVVFVPRDPQWAYVFWEITAADQARAAAAQARQLCLRVADVTGLPLGASHPHALQELIVEADCKEWYLPIPLSDREYRIELGYRLSGGGWLSLAYSAVARMPAAEPGLMLASAIVPFNLEAPSPVTAPLPVSSGGVQHEQLYQRATNGGRIRRIGSEALHEQGAAVDQADQHTASGAGVWASGRNESGRGIERRRSFWLVADAELIVYGATEPSASLFIGDREVDLDDNGTFRVHVPFQDGQQPYPIRAIAADAEQQRSIRMEFERSTPAARVNSAADAIEEWF